MDDLVSDSRNHGHLNNKCIPSNCNNNIEARRNSIEFFTELSFQMMLSQPPFSGGNSNILPIAAKCNSETYIFPPGCRFYCGNVKTLASSLSKDLKFDFILLDPPWWNKYIRRKKLKDPSAGLVQY